MSEELPDSQGVCRGITRSAIFLVATVGQDSAHADAVRDWCGDIAAYVRAVGTRAPAANLSCVCGFGADAWDRLFGAPRPASLHPFKEVKADTRHAVRTPGDILMHIRAD